MATQRFLCQLRSVAQEHRSSDAKGGVTAWQTTFAAVAFAGQASWALGGKFLERETLAGFLDLSPHLLFAVPPLLLDRQPGYVRQPACSGKRKPDNGIDMSVLGMQKLENGICSQFSCKTRKFPEIFEIGQNAQKSVLQSGERGSAPAPGPLQHHGEAPEGGGDRAREVPGGSVRKCAERARHPGGFSGASRDPHVVRGSVRKCVEVCARLRPVPVREPSPMAWEGGPGHPGAVLAGVGPEASRASGCLENGLRQIFSDFPKILAEKRASGPKTCFRTSLDRPHAPPMTDRPEPCKGGESWTVGRLAAVLQHCKAL